MFHFSFWRSLINVFKSLPLLGVCVCVCVYIGLHQIKSTPVADMLTFMAKASK